MKRVLVITVAGTCSRFNKELQAPVLKCLYSTRDLKDSILFRMIQLGKNFEKIVLVGGYKFDELKEYVNKMFSLENIDLIYNDHYRDLGSFYSLKLGLEKALQYAPQEIVFSEGDLIFDRESFEKISELPCDIITYSGEPITANKAVVFYLSADNCPHYVYDTSHQLLAINDPFAAIYNSAQVWKFTDITKLRNVLDSLAEVKEGTNLVLINDYFSGNNNVYLLGMKKWFNCNTPKDYKKAMEEIQDD